ncbi:hypothetical protein HYH03_003866 [Edaphochlamys debaryana]|uniref:Uncharacterized protein n=1 Tax=Edaphochlamys debaryana TaxID=47281 RepID=A0A835Y8P6_9CHLO|nr:hypothetical protein HYH03_003866 [Edaphochlamys debaryana]|eukprot:KAG2498108.1 hypothetical protein HYH03_003866 [Edaphochlamys debaryana]
MIAARPSFSKWMTLPAGTQQVIVVLVAVAAVQAVFSGLQALLSLYAFLYWVARGQVLPPNLEHCHAYTTWEALYLHWFMLVKVIGGAMGVASGLAFAAQYTSTMLFQVRAYVAPKGFLGALAEWLVWDVPLALFFLCSMGMHVLGYALLGAVTDGRADDKHEYTLPQRLWATLWRAAVSSTANVPWRERCGIAAPDFDAPAPTGSRNTRAWLVFTTSLSVSVSLAVAEAAALLSGRLKYAEVYEYKTDKWSYYSSYYWPNDDMGVAWILGGFACGAVLFLLLAVGLAELRHRRRILEDRTSEKALPPAAAAAAARPADPVADVEGGKAASVKQGGSVQQPLPVVTGIPSVSTGGGREAVAIGYPIG